MKTISIDNCTGVDQFRRVRLSRRLLDAVLAIDGAASGAVIGLEGRWGSGKTHVLQALEALVEEVEEERRPILVRFNPWMMSGARDIVNALLVQLAAALSADEAPPGRRRFRPFGARPPASAGAALAENLMHYASLLAVLKSASWVADAVSPGTGFVLGDLVGRTASEVASTAGGLSKALKHFGGSPAGLSLPEIRGRVLRGLKEQRRRIVVLVDDLDRLPPVELAEMFRAVKAVADFPNVVYVLSYDPEIVSSALKSSLRIRDGRAYLEKIVHLPIVVPEIPAGTFHGFAIARLQSALADPELESSEAADLNMAYRLAAAMIATPRDVERLRTRVRYVSEIMLRKVNMADVLLLEALNQCVPSVGGWIRENVALLTEPGKDQWDEHVALRGVFESEGLRLLRKGATTDEERRKLIDVWKSCVPDSRRSEAVPIENVLRFLFGAMHFPGTQEKRSNYRRCSVYAFLNLWRCGGLSHDLFGPEEIAELVSARAPLNRDRVLADEDSFADFCQQLFWLDEESIPPVDPVWLAEGFATAEGLFGQELVADFGRAFGPFPTLIKMIDRSDHDAAIAAVGRLVELGTVWLSGLTLHRLMLDAASNARNGVRDVLTSAQIAPVVSEWFEKVDEAIRAGAWPADGTERTVHELLTIAVLMGCDAQRARGIMAAALAAPAVGLKRCFADLADGYRISPMRIEWSVLPPPAELVKLIDADSVFSSTHSEFVAMLKARAASEAAGSSTEASAGAD